MVAAPAAVMRVNVRCSGFKRLKNGDQVLCNNVLAKVEVGRWELDMASEAELYCENCGKRYTLAEYKGRKLQA